MILGLLCLPVQRWHAGGDWGALTTATVTTQATCGSTALRVRPLRPQQPQCHIAAVWPRHPRQSLGTLWLAQATAVTASAQPKKPSHVLGFFVCGSGTSRE